MIAIVVFVTSSVNVAMMMRTKCSSVFVVMMRAASKQNVRTESDERCAMDETSEHGTVSLQLCLMAGGLFAADELRSIAIDPKSHRLLIASGPTLPESRRGYWDSPLSDRIRRAN